MNSAKKIMAIIAATTFLIPHAALAQSTTSARECTVGQTISVNWDKKPAKTGLSLFSLDTLSEDEIEFLEYMAEEYKKRTDEIPLSPENAPSVTLDRFKEIYHNYMGGLMQYEYPELFYAFTNYIINSITENGVTTYTISPTYAMPEDWASFEQNVRPKGENEEKEEYDEYYVKVLKEFVADETVKAHIDEAQQDIANEIENIVTGTENMSDLEKVLYVHDYIVANYEYDTRVYDAELSGSESRTLYSMVREKKGVCQGYTYLFMSALREMGIDCKTVPSDELAHIWNKVKLDGEWYNVDLTYDDPISDISCAVNHEFFLVNDDEIKNLDPSDVSGTFYTIDEDNFATPAGDCTLKTNEDGTVTITNSDGQIIAENCIAIDYGSEFEGETGYKIAVSIDTPVALYKVTEASHHCVWNNADWAGRSTEPSVSTTFSASPLHNISGRTVYNGDSFYCLDEKNQLCKIDFEQSEALTALITESSAYKWFKYGDDRHFYGSVKNPLYFSSLETVAGRIFLNSPQAVYEYDAAENRLTEIYAYEDEQPDNTDVSRTYFFGLRVVDGDLYAEFSTGYDDNGAMQTVTPIEISTIKNLDAPQVTPNDDNTVTVTAYIPDEFAHKAQLYIAEYDENNALVNLIAPEDDIADFTPSASTRSIKAFIWNIKKECCPISDASDVLTLDASQADTPQ